MCMYLIFYNKLFNNLVIFYEHLKFENVYVSTYSLGVVLNQ